jgi:hypothetical protein
LGQKKKKESSGLRKEPNTSRMFQRQVGPQNACEVRATPLSDDLAMISQIVV